MTDRGHIKAARRPSREVPTITKRIDRMHSGWAIDFVGSWAQQQISSTMEVSGFRSRRAFESLLEKAVTRKAY
jgi:hypothetical protein